MNIHLSQRIPPPDDPVPIARSIILYDDPATRISGKAFCEALTDELGGGYRPLTLLWRMDALEHSRSSARAAIYAATSALIVISARGDALPLRSTTEWLRKHARVSANPGRLVIFLSDSAIRRPEVCTEIRRQIETALVGSDSTLLCYATGNHCPDPDDA